MLFICYPKCGTCRKAERWLAEQGITQPEGLLAFQELGYRFSPAHSSGNRLVYIREP